HPERRARLWAWRSAIVRHPRVAKDLLFSYLRPPRVAKHLLFSYLRPPRVAKDLLFSYLCRSSLYAGADIGQEEIPLRLARRPDRRHRVASRERRPRGQALHRGKGGAR